MRSILCLSLLFAGVVLTAVDARAYIDAGTGSLVIQSVLGVLLAALFTLKLYWQKVKALFGRSATEKKCCNCGCETTKDTTSAEQ